MRLTAELISRSPQILNAIRERELNLRGNKIPAIENLGATLDQFDCIDLSDNEVQKLDGFPVLKRVQTLLLCNNRIARIGNNFRESLPNLDSLILTNNFISNLADLDPLTDMPRLRCLCLIDNPVTKRTHYRLYVLNKIPGLKLLDFRKVKEKERQAAYRLFGGPSARAAIAEAAGANAANKPKTFVPGQIPDVGPSSAVRPGPTPQEIMALKTAIAKATTLEEVSRLEKALKTGNIPPEIKAAAAGVIIGALATHFVPASQSPPPQPTEVTVASSSHSNSKSPPPAQSPPPAPTTQSPAPAPTEPTPSVMETEKAAPAAPQPDAMQE